MLSVNDLMNTEPRTLRPDHTLSEAAKALWDGNCGGLPVVDDELHPVGFLTDRDIAMSGAIQGLPLHDLNVSSSMTGRCVTVPAGTSAGRLQELMREHRVTRLPVVNDDGALVGLVTVSDLVSHVATQTRATKLAGELRQTLGELSHSGLATRTAATNGKAKAATKPTTKTTAARSKATAGAKKTTPTKAGAPKAARATKAVKAKVGAAKAKAAKTVTAKTAKGSAKTVAGAKKTAARTGAKTAKKAVRKKAATRTSGQGFLPLTAKKTSNRRKAATKSVGKTKAPARRAAKGRSAGA